MIGVGATSNQTQLLGHALVNTSRQEKAFVRRHGYADEDAAGRVRPFGFHPDSMVRSRNKMRPDSEHMSQKSCRHVTVNPADVHSA